MAALTLMTASSVMAQAENGGGGGGNGDRNGGGPGGQRQRRWDPAQMQQQNWIKRWTCSRNIQR